MFEFDLLDNDRSVSWLLGAAAKEDITACKVRARAANSMLVQSAADGETLLFGHGWMIRMIGSELRRQGVKNLDRTNGGYWSRKSLNL